jgi:hypothetical protein
MPEDLELLVEQTRQILAALTALRADVAAFSPAALLQWTGALPNNP